MIHSPTTFQIKVPLLFYSEKRPSCAALTLTATLLCTLIFSSTTAFASSVKVAFIGDQGVRSNAREVLELIAREDTDLLLIQGDLGYDDNSATTWDSQLTTALGQDFPVMVTVGNHENFEWPLYQRLIQRRMDRINDLSCTGDVGVKSKCTYQNIDVVQIAPGIYEVDGVDAEDDYASYIRSAFARTNDHWRICSWHKPHKMMQTGTKTGPSSWDTYDACLDAGAMVALAHHHSYSRTHLLSDYSTQTVVHTNDEMAMQPGQSFAFVSGLGGLNTKPQARGGDYFASIYTADQGASAGALFCTFENTTANCYFKAIDGAVPDQFSLTRGAADTIDTQAPPPPAALPAFDDPLPTQGGGGYVLSRSDKQELRWIDQDDNGVWSNVWIDEECAASLGGVSATGDWAELLTIAPGFDGISYPCTNSSNPVQDTQSPITTPPITTGFAFQRTDKNEYRWIEENSSGELGSIWIDKACADRNGGVQESGNWRELMELAPGFDTISSPCY